MSGITISDLLGQHSPLVMPVAHDALSARLIEAAGFGAYSVGGFALAGIRYGLPDIGLMSLAEASAGVKDIMRGSRLPVLIDADDGYGDVKSVVRTVRTYEAMGAAGIALEDQTSPKRCGHMAGKSVVDTDLAVRKLEAAMWARHSEDFFILARTDARAVYDLDEALHRAERYIETGVDGVFVEAPESVDELRTIGARFQVPTLVNMAEGGRTPIISPAELAEFGFSMVVYPSTLLLRVINAIRHGLEGIRTGQLELPPDTMEFGQLTSLFGIQDWADIDERFGVAADYLRPADRPVADTAASDDSPSG
jgi:2-methylisocitrate lyase-like PEP mutase family enzyme